MRRSRTSILIHVGKDMSRVNSLRWRLEATSGLEVVRRALITLEMLLDVRENGGEVVICKKGQPERLVLPL